jgi:hypothetical protein
VLTRTGDEWIGVDCASGAFVRAQGGIGGEYNEIADPVEGVQHAVGRHGVVRDVRPAVVEFVIAPLSVPVDPSRPELVEPERRPEILFRPKQRALRRCLRALVTPEAKGGTVLGTRGPSIAFVDLDGTTPSVQLLRISRKRIEIGIGPDGEVVCELPWGGATLRVRVVDVALAAAAVASAPRPLRGSHLQGVLGFRPRYLLVGLGRVHGGHVQKVALAML